jgi:hypothetical protein
MSPNIHRPIYERVAELQKEKSRKMHELVSDREEKAAQEMTFKPQINRQSQILAQQKLTKDMINIQNELQKDRDWVKDTAGEVCIS